MTSAKKIGFVDGFRAPFEGLRFVLSQPSTWGWALVPLALVVVVVAACVVGGLALVGHVERTWAWLAHAETMWKTIVGALFRIFVVLSSLFLGLYLAVPLSGFALERIVRSHERKLGAARYLHARVWRSTLRSFGASIGSIVFAAVVFVVLLLVDAIDPPAAIVTEPLRVLFAALALAWDLLDYPLAMRPMPLGSRIGWFFRHFSAMLGFGAGLTILFLLPGANVLLLPAGVAGAAKLVVESERRSALLLER